MFGSTGFEQNNGTFHFTPEQGIEMILDQHIMFIYLFLVFYVAFNSQGHIATGSLQVEETSAYCTVNHRALASNYQLSNMKCPARDSNRRPQRLEARILKDFQVVM